MPEIHLLGQINSGVGFSNGSYFIKYYMRPRSEDWTKIEGSIDGQTNISVGGIMGDDTLIWNHGFDNHFSCMSLQGWPILVIELWGVDEFDKVGIVGYGSCFIPPSHGHHELEIVLWSPILSFWQKLSKIFLGSFAYFTDFINSFALQENRFPLKTDSLGIINVSIDVLVKGFAEKGVELG